MEIKKLDSPVSISDSSLVRLKEMGNITEIMYSEKRSRGGYITQAKKNAENTEHMMSVFDVMKKMTPEQLTEVLQKSSAEMAQLNIENE